MKLKIFKPAILIAALFAICNTGFAQITSAQTDSMAIPVAPVIPYAPAAPAPVAITVSAKVSKVVKVQLRQMVKQLNKVSATTNAQLTAALKNVNVGVDLNNLLPQINLGFKNGNDNANSDDNQQGDEQLTKTYTKTYPVDANDALVIDSRYGNVVVNTWDRSEFKVDVTIRVTGDDQDKAQKMLDNVSISDAKDGSGVSFRTNIGENKSSGWFSMFNGDNNATNKMEINYTVYMPAKNELVIDNRYGGIVLPDLSGKVTINSAYGSFSAKSLSNQSAIRVKYGTTKIESLGTAALDVSYSTLDIGSVDRLELNISYGNGPAKIGKIRETGSINIKYGDGLQIADIQKSMKSLAINASYTGVSLGLSGDEDDNFDVSVHYGDFNHSDRNITITSKDPNDDRPHLSRSYRGYLGKGNAGKSIAINSSYGDVKFQ
jgi:hypothetical protein